MAGEVADPANRRGAFRHRDHAAGLQQVEGVAALQDEVQGRGGQLLRHQVRGLGLIDREQLLEPLRVGGLEVVGALTLLKRQPDVAVGAVAIPGEIPDALHVLEVHREALQAVGDLDRDRPAIDAAALLEVGELGHLHAIQPDLPAHTPGTEGWGLPVVLDEANVVVLGANAQGLERSQIGLLNRVRTGLNQHLVLEVVLGPVRVIAVAAIGGPATGLRVGHRPGLRPDGPQHRVGAHRPGALLRVVGLKDQATPLSPEAVQGLDDVLEMHGCSGPGASCGDSR